MRVYLDKNQKQLHGLALRFPFTPESVARVKFVLDLMWDKSQNAWVSQGPEVLLDMQRFGIEIADMSWEARRIAEAFRQELWDIMDVRAEDSEELYAYQRQGTEILSHSSRFLLGDDMGLGKTKQVLDAIAKKELREVLIVAPNTLTYNWVDEIQKWHPEIEVGIVPDQKKTTRLNKRSGQPGKIGRMDFWDNPPRVVIANYEKLILGDWPLGRRWQLFVTDEATRFKNSSTQIWKRVRLISRQSERFWPLTGTPLETRLMELYNIFAIMRPSVLGSYVRFRDQHLITDWAGSPIGAKNIELLRERIGMFMLRRTKAEVLKQLPAKIYTQIFIKMNPREQAEYQKLLTEFDTWLEERDVGGSASPLVKTLRARQFTCTPHVLNPWLPRGSKYEALLELLQDHNGKTVIFCEWEEVTKLLSQWLQKDMGYNPEAYISGAVGAEDRIKRVREFNEGKLGDIFISTDAGQQGINLTGADMVVHYNQLWNPQKMHQREDRAHRIGQKNSVTVVDLLVMDTVDAGMYELNREREELFDSVVEGAEEVMLRKLSPARLRRVMEGRLNARKKSEE